MRSRDRPSDSEVTITLSLDDAQAYQYAHFLKRVCLEDYERRAASREDAHVMVNAGEKIRHALARKGYAPR